MHAAEREKAILGLLQHHGFISFRELEQRVDASPATLRRDLERMASAGRIDRVRGGAKLSDRRTELALQGGHSNLSAVPFLESVDRQHAQDEAIGRAAAALCKPGQAVMIDGGATTLQMCRHLDGLNLQVLTNSLQVVGALFNQAGTRILIPGGAVFHQQSIVLSASGDDLMPRFHAPKLFMGPAAVGIHGVMQADVVLVVAEHRLIERAEELIVLVHSSRFLGSSGNVVCELNDVDVVVTDDGIRDEHVAMLEAARIKVIVA